MDTIGKRISRIRKDLGLTQRELAEKLHVLDKTVSRWETDRQIPDALTMQEIAAALNVSVSKLYGLEETEQNELQDKAMRTFPLKRIRKIFFFGFIFAMLIILIGICIANHELNSKVSCQTDEFPLYMLTGYDQSIVEWVEYCDTAGEKLSHLSALGGETAYYLFYLPRGCEDTGLEYSYRYGLRGRVLRLNFNNVSESVDDEYYLCYIKFPCEDIFVLKTYIDGRRVDSYGAYGGFMGLCENILFK